MPVKVKAIGYDVDGVLRPLDTIVQSWVDTFVWFLNQRGLKVDRKVMEKFTPKIKSLGRKGMFDEICNEFGLKRLSQSDFQRFNDYQKQNFRQQILDSPIAREARDAIVFFGERGYKQFIASAAPKSEIVRWFLGQMGCQSYIQKIYASSLKGSLNKAEAIKDFCQTNSLQPSEVAFVGDSPSDVIAARKAGAKAILLASRKEKAAAVRAHRRLRSISQLSSVIQKKPRQRRHH